MIENKGEVSSDEYEEGEIANQDPVAGEMVAKDSTVGVVVSNGKGSIDVPGVVGKKADDAANELTNAGFRPDKTYSYSDTVQEGYVISQTPNGGEKGKEGDTITLVISQGVEAVTVPDVKTTYKSEEQAKDLLKDFNVTVKTAYSDILPEGIVMDQSIEPGKQVEKGSAITITVSQGPEPSQVVTATTYKFKLTIKPPADTSNVSGANIVLYDTAGNILEQWNDQSISMFGTDGLVITKTGLLVNQGKVVITWLDLNGSKLNDQIVEDVSGAFTKETQ